MGSLLAFTQRWCSRNAWRLLNNCHQDFKCKFGIHNKYFEWYTMLCGIHQGMYHAGQVYPVNQIVINHTKII